jgi:hypothetical protein
MWVSVGKCERIQNSFLSFGGKFFQRCLWYIIITTFVLKDIFPRNKLVATEYQHSRKVKRSAGARHSNCHPSHRQVNNKIVVLDSFDSNFTTYRFDFLLGVLVSAQTTVSRCVWTWRVLNDGDRAILSCEYKCDLLEKDFERKRWMAFCFHRKTSTFVWRPWFRSPLTFCLHLYLCTIVQYGSL